MGFRTPADVSFDGHDELYICNAGDGSVLGLPPTERGAVKPERHMLLLSGQDASTGIDKDTPKR